MIYEKRSALTGKWNTMEIPLTLEQIDAWRTGNRSIQQCFPHLTVDQREFLITGSTPAEWDFIKDCE